MMNQKREKISIQLKKQFVGYFLAKKVIKLYYRKIHNVEKKERAFILKAFFYYVFFYMSQRCYGFKLAIEQSYGLKMEGVIMEDNQNTTTQQVEEKVEKEKSNIDIDKLREIADKAKY